MMVGRAAAAVSDVQHNMANTLQACSIQCRAAPETKHWSGAPYWVRAEVMVVLAEAAKPLDWHDSTWDNEVMIRDPQGYSAAPLLCRLIPLPAVLAADVRPYPKIV